MEKIHCAVQWASGGGADLAHAARAPRLIDPAFSDSDL